LGQLTSIGELNTVIKDFFQVSLQIPTGRTTLYLRNHESFNGVKNLKPLGKNHNDTHELKKHLVENFIRSGSEVQRYVQEKQILIYDEIEFSHFYDKNPIRTCVLEFLAQASWCRFGFINIRIAAVL